MSVYSLENIGLKDYTKDFLELAKKEYVNAHFKIGEKINKREQNFQSIMMEIMCSNNCELETYLSNKLQGAYNEDLEPIKIIGGNSNVIINNITQIIQENAHWNEVDW
jgi:hypothetical protein